MHLLYRPSAGRTLPAMLLTLTLFVVLAFAVLFAARALDPYLPAHSAGMIGYILGGTLFFFLALRRRSRSRHGSTEPHEREDGPQEPAAEPDSSATDALDSMRRRIKERKDRRDCQCDPTHDGQL